MPFLLLLKGQHKYSELLQYSKQCKSTNIALSPETLNKLYVESLHHKLAWQTSNYKDSKIIIILLTKPVLFGQSFSFEFIFQSSFMNEKICPITCFWNNNLLLNAPT